MVHYYISACILEILSNFFFLFSHPKLSAAVIPLSTQTIKIMAFHKEHHTVLKKDFFSLLCKFWDTWWWKKHTFFSLSSSLFSPHFLHIPGWDSTADRRKCTRASIRKFCIEIILCCILLSCYCPIKIKLFIQRFVLYKSIFLIAICLLNMVPASKYQKYCPMFL